MVWRANVLDWCKSFGLLVPAIIVAGDVHRDALPDFDCLQDAEADAVVEDVQRFSESLLFFEKTGSIASSGWYSWDKEHTLWERSVAQLFRHDATALSASCPFAVDTLQVAQWGACLFAWRLPSTVPYVRYLGCFGEGIIKSFCCGPRTFGYDHDSCTQACTGFRHMALAAKGQCFCGDLQDLQREEEAHRDGDVFCDGSFGLGHVWNGAIVYVSVFALEVRTPTLNNADVARHCAKLRVYFGPWLHYQPFGLSKPHDVLPVFLNTRFVIPMCQTVLSLRTQARVYSKHLDPKGKISDKFDCPLYQQLPHSSGIGWAKILNWLISNVQQSVDFRWESWVKRKELINMFSQHEDECRFGYLVLILADLLIAHNFWTEEADTLAFAVVDMFEKLNSLFMRTTHPSTEGLIDTLTALILTRWPVLHEFCKLATNSHVLGQRPTQVGPQRKPYVLDFKPRELLQPLLPGKTDVQSLATLPRTEHLSLLRASLIDKSSTSKAFIAVLQALELVLKMEPEKHSKKIVFVTILWGQRYARYLKGFLDRSQAFDLARRHVIFCLDDASCGSCADDHPHPILCVAGHVKGIPQKFTVVAAMLQAGFDVLLLDFDLVLLRNPIPVVLEAAHQRDAEVLVARDFGGQCLNVGVVYFKASQNTIAFITALIIWLWFHPYECDQKAFSGLLGHENLTDEVRFGSPLNKVPRWAVLDPINHFVTSVVYNKGVEGWSGLIDNIVIYHFLDGSGDVDASSALLGEYVNLFDLFYANAKLDLGNTDVPLWLQDAAVRAQLMSTRIASPPEHLSPCKQLPTAAEFPVS